MTIPERAIVRARAQLALIIGFVIGACGPLQPPRPSRSVLHQIAIPVRSSLSLQADIYGSGPRGVLILAHGGYSSRSSWGGHAKVIAAAGYRVMVLEASAAALLAAGTETACLYDVECLAKDVNTGIAYLRQVGVKSVALIAGSMGAGAIAQASTAGGPNTVQGLVLLSPASIAEPERMRGDKLFIATREDSNSSGPRMPRIQTQFNRAREPKRLIVFEGNEHGQNILLSKDGDALLGEILRFLALLK